MPPVEFAADEYRYALDYCAAASRELTEFKQYFEGTVRFPAVDTAVLNIVRMRIEILNERGELKPAPASLGDDDRDDARLRR